MRTTLALAVVAAAAVAAPAHAAPVIYDISFTTTVTTGAQPATPSGSFTYDPATGRFSDFTVTNRGVTFDVAISANGWRIPGPGSGCITGASAFDILAGTTGCASNQLWGFEDADPMNGFFLFASTSPFEADVRVLPFGGTLFSSAPLPAGDGPDDGGTFSIAVRNTPEPVPAPGALALFGIGLAGLAATRRRAARRNG